MSQKQAERRPNAIFGLMTSEQVADGRSGHTARAGLPQCPKDFVCKRIAKQIAEDVGSRRFAEFPNRVAARR